MVKSRKNPQHILIGGFRCFYICPNIISILWLRMNPRLSAFMQKGQGCCTWISLVERRLYRVFVLENVSLNLKQFKMVTNTCQPVYNGGPTQGWSCSANGIWLRILLSQGLGWWCVFAGRQTFGFCLTEHLKQGGIRDLACSVHTLFF